MQEMYHPSDLAAMDPLVLMKNLDHVRMTSRRLSYILQQQVHLDVPEANELRIEIDQGRQARQVAEITETDYFQELREKAKALRHQSKT